MVNSKSKDNQRSHSGRSSEAAKASRTGPTPASISYPTSAGNSPDNSVISSGPAVRATTSNEVHSSPSNANSKVTNIERYQSKPLKSNSVEAANTDQTETSHTPHNSHGEARRRKVS
ncbi:MAG: hypothetical protein ACLGPM_06685 [Acidobacteriota bacterium]